MRVVLSWPSLEASTFLYGSLQEAGHLKNAYLPAGQILASWFSERSYQADRQTPNFPLLKPGRKYALVAEAEGGRFHFQISYLDRWDQMFSQAILQPPKADFDVPLETSKIQLDLVANQVEDLCLTRLEVVDAI